MAYSLPLITAYHCLYLSWDCPQVQSKYPRSLHHGSGQNLNKVCLKIIFDDHHICSFIFTHT